MSEAPAEGVTRIVSHVPERRIGRLLARLLAVPATAVVVVVGVWLTGGVITNDFALAMWLAAGWMAVAGLIVIAIAVRSRAVGIPVVGAYLLTALVLGVYLGSSVFLDDVVDERVASVAPTSGNELLAAGQLESVRHSARGAARIVELANGGRVLTLTGFAVDNGPDLRVYLVAGQATTEGEVDDHVDLGGLKGNKGDQQYTIPGKVDLRRYSTVVIWCRAFSVLFARAPVR